MEITAFNIVTAEVHSVEGEVALRAEFESKALHWRTEAFPQPSPALPSPPLPRVTSIRHYRGSLVRKIEITTMTTLCHEGINTGLGRSRGVAWRGVAQFAGYKQGLGG